MTQKTPNDDSQGNTQSWNKTGIFYRLFPSCDFIIRRDGTARSYLFSTSAQVFLCFIFIACVGWTAFTSYFYLEYGTIVSHKNDKISTLRTAYQTLLQDIAVYRDHIFQVANSLEENRIAMVSLLAQKIPPLDDEKKIRKVNPFALPERSTFDTEISRLSFERERLNTEILHVQGRLSFLADGNTLRENEQHLPAISFRKALLQRDLATSESEELKERIKGLEEFIAQMQDTQIMAFQKMASIADGGIETIEKRLSSVKTSLADVGLGIDTLLGRVRRNNENSGIGGPFIPAPVQSVRPANLNISLVSLNQRLNNWYDLTSLQQSLPIGVPLTYIRVTSPFGAREDPFQGAPARHEAVDLGGIIGEAVFATAPGKVVRAGRWGWYGNIVEIDHGLGFRTRYAHMDKIFVNNGETVRSGDRIGSVGNSGRSTGSHLHYEIRVKGQAVDPVKFIKVGQNVFKSE